MDQVLDKKLQQNYEAGFTTDVQSETLPPGLNEDVIRKISEIKQEPEWLLQFRLRAYDRWNILKQPDWSNLEINPIDERLMTITLRGIIPTTFINTYMETAEHHEKNRNRYELLKKTFNKYKNKGPTFTGGDFNAKISNELDNDGVSCIGEFTFDQEHVDTTLDETMQENRDHLIGHCGGQTA